MILWVLLIILVTSLLTLINTLFYSLSKDKWSNSPFECGMDQIQKDRTPMYMHFIFISLVFLVFDVELVISIPVIMSLLMESVWNLFWVFFFIIMTVGLLLEIRFGTIDWKN